MTIGPKSDNFNKEKEEKKTDFFLPYFSFVISIIIAFIIVQDKLAVQGILKRSDNFIVKDWIEKKNDHTDINNNIEGA